MASFGFNASPSSGSGSSEGRRPSGSSSNLGTNIRNQNQFPGGTLNVGPSGGTPAKHRRSMYDDDEDEDAEEEMLRQRERTGASIGSIGGGASSSGRTSSSPKSSSAFDVSDSNARTQSTAYEALLSKYSASSLGYFDDKYLKAIITAQNFKGYQRKPPIINRGYYTRVKSIQRLVKTFMDLTADYGDRGRQIVSLGSGLDTMSLNLVEMNVPGLKLFEIDFPAVINQKVDMLLKLPVIVDLLKLKEHLEARQESGTMEPPQIVTEEIATLPTISEDEEENEMSPRRCSNIPASPAASSAAAAVSESPKKPTDMGPPPIRPRSRSFSLYRKDDFKTDFGYHLSQLTLLSADLREQNAVRDILLTAGVNPELPTLFISECVLVYIDQPSVLSLCSSIGSTFPNSAWVTYDMMNPTDRFGRTMLNNLRSQKHTVPGFTDFPTPSHQVGRFTQSGWGTAACISMLQAFKRFIFKDVDEMARVAKLEIFDEIEEWELIMDHYALTLAVNGELLGPLLHDFHA
jgi:O-methyltransferase involved in polyketide biosynthesis